MAKLTITNEQAVFEGRRCLVLRQGRFAVWVDPQMGYAVVRQLIYGKMPAVRSQMDVFYRDDPRHGIVPVRWTWIRHRGDGGLMGSSVSTVTSFEINPVVPDSAFELDIPPDTLVSDQRDPQASVRYVQREGGRRFVVN